MVIRFGKTMQIVIAGGHGKIAMLLHSMLVERGHHVRGLIRSPDQAADLQREGAEPAVCDLETEDDISGAVGIADAVVFAAGAGPGSGAARKWSVDQDGAIKLMDAAKRNGIRRYVMISAMNAEQPRGGEVFQIYLQAKAEADAALRASGLDYTIVRPGRLTDEPGTGRVAIARDLPRGEIPRADVAEVLMHVLENPSTAHLQFDVTLGKHPIPEAIRKVVGEG